MAFLETFSLYLLHDLPWKPEDREVRLEFEKLWGHLRKGCLYFMRFVPGEHTWERILAAQRELLAYGKRAEEVRHLFQLLQEATPMRPSAARPRRNLPASAIHRVIIHRGLPCDVQVFGGSALCTFKLHLAAMHLADQVRASGPSAYSLEYWVERMVQLYKRLIKYRSTAAPELLFINDNLLLRVCERLLLELGADDLKVLSEAVQAARVARRKGPQVEAEPADDCLLGAPRPMDEDESAEVLPPETGQLQVPLKGLPYLLAADTDMATDGWPTGGGLPTPAIRARSIMRRLGVTVGTRVGDDGVSVLMRKFVRVALPMGDTASSMQCLTQTRKDNSWFLIRYLCTDGGQLLYVGRVRYYVLAQLKTADGTDLLPNATSFSEPLRLAVADLYSCQALHGRAVRPACEATGQPPEFLTVATLERIGENRADKPYAGTWVIDVRSITCVVVPTKAIGTRRYFMVANKASGRIGRLHRM